MCKRALNAFSGRAVLPQGYRAGVGRLRQGQAAQGDTGQEQGRGGDTKVFPVEGQLAYGNTFRLMYEGGHSGKRIV